MARRKLNNNLTSLPFWMEERVKICDFIGLCSLEAWEYDYDEWKKPAT